MNFTTTLLFYVLFGVAAAIAIHSAPAAGSGGQRWFRTLTAVVFWPLYLPALLQQPARRIADPGGSNGSSHPDIVAGDEMSAAIQQVETELNLALESLGGWSDGVLA